MPAVATEPTATTRVTSGQEPAAISASSTHTPVTMPIIAVPQPLTITGRARPRKSGIRRAGLVSTSPSVWARRSPPMMKVIANMPGIAA